MKPTQHPRRGFTLIEMSIVLLLIALVVGGGLVTLTGSLQASQYNNTVERMDAIEKALLNYATTTNRIPCPADLTLTASSANYGLEAGAGSGSAIATATGACTGTGMLPQANYKSATGAYEGGVPTRALQLPDDYMYDAWGRKFRYAVDAVYTKAASLPASQVSPCSVPSISAITVNDATGATRTTAGMYALISNGANGHGAYTSNGVTYNAGVQSTDELTNCHCTNAGVYNGTYTPSYVEKVPQYDAGQTGNPVYSFDDIVTFKEAWQMQTPNYPLTVAGQCLYVTDCGGNRVEIFNTSGTYAGQIGGCSSGGCTASSSIGNFNCPTGVTFDRSGNIWVTDMGNQRLVKYNGNGVYVSTFTDSNLNNPMAMAFDSTGSFWVAQGNTNANAAVKYSAAGSYITEINGTGGGWPSLWLPQYVAIDSSNNVYFDSAPSEAIGKYNSNGTWLAGTGDIGSGGVLIDSSGNVWAPDSPNGYEFVTEYNSSLVPTGTAFSINVTSAGGMALDRSGNFWLVDPQAPKVYEFTSAGTQIQSFGSSGSGNGQFNYTGSYFPNTGAIAIGNR